MWSEVARAWAGTKKIFRIRLKAYDHEAIDASAAQDRPRQSIRTGCQASWVRWPLPTEKNVYLRHPLLRISTKDSREHFRNAYAQAVDRHPRPKRRRTVDALMRIDLPGQRRRQHPVGEPETHGKKRAFWVPSWA